MTARRNESEIVHSSYRECEVCTLPYIEEVNGRNGQCDFCAEAQPAAILSQGEDPHRSAIPA